jgi:glycosyltransferase involved in cell wall biosynthesis
MQRFLKSKVAVLIAFSDFSPGRGYYIGKALEILGYKVFFITTKPVYSWSSVNKLRMHLIKRLYESLIGRFFIYLFFMLKTFFHLLHFLDSSNCILYSRGPHPFTDIPILLYKKIVKNCKFVIDMTDLWPEALEYVKMNHLIKKIFIKLGYLIISFVFSHADAIITHNQLMKIALERKYRRRVFVLEGTLDLEKFSPKLSQDIRNIIPNSIINLVKDRFVILYAGLLGPSQKPDIILDLAEEFKFNSRILFLILGDGPLRKYLENQAHKKKLTNICFYGPVPHDEMPYYYRLAHLAILTYAPTKFLSVGLPKKFIEYSASGIPILCISPSCVASKLCLEYSAGLWIDNTRADWILSAKDQINLVINDENFRRILGQNARKMAEKIFSLQNAAFILSSILE